MTSHATVEPQLFSITALGTATSAAATQSAPARMRLWRRAVLALSAAAVTSPIIATTTTGHAGWTAAAALLGAIAAPATVISHAHAETAVPWHYEPEPVEITYIDAAGNHVSYRVRPGTTEAA